MSYSKHKNPIFTMGIIWVFWMLACLCDENTNHGLLKTSFTWNMFTFLCNIQRFYSWKNDIFNWTNCECFFFITISVQNIYCWYTLEPPCSNEYPQSKFWSKHKKNIKYPCKPQFYDGMRNTYLGIMDVWALWMSGLSMRSEYESWFIGLLKTSSQDILYMELNVNMPLQYTAGKRQFPMRWQWPTLYVLQQT